MNTNDQFALLAMGIERNIEFNAEKAHYALRMDTLNAMDELAAQASYHRRSMGASLRGYRNARLIGGVK